VKGWRLEVRNHKGHNQQRVFEVWDDDQGEEHTRPLGVARGRNSSALKWEFELLKSCAQFQYAGGADRLGRYITVVKAEDSKDALVRAGRKAQQSLSGEAEDGDGDVPALAAEGVEPFQSVRVGRDSEVVTIWKVTFVVIPITIYAAARALSSPLKRCDEIEKEARTILPGVGLPSGRPEQKDAVSP
jgi:hypothetical protein